MSSYKYSPVTIPSASNNARTAAAAHQEDNDHHNMCSRMLLVAPLYHFVLDPILDRLPSSFLAVIVQGATFWRRLLKCPIVSPLWNPYLADITLAHAILALPLIGWFVSATELALFHPTSSHHALSHSGKMTSYAMTATFLTANKSHSLISLVTGLSFDRLVTFHLASAILTLYMALLHGIQIAYYNRGATAADSSHHHHDDEDHDDEDEEDHHHSHSHDDHHDSHDDQDEHEHDDHDHDHEHERFLHQDSIHAYLGTEPNLWKFFFDGDQNTSGFAVLVALSILVVTSVFHRLFRKWWFEGWLVTHISGALIVLAAGIIHGADIFVFAIIWWALDLLIRYGVMVGIRYPRQATLTRVAENVTMMQWPKSDNFQYEAGQFVQVAIPGVRMWEFHPFSIASSPEDSIVTLYMRALPGTKPWTRQVYEFAAPRDDNKISIGIHRVFVEGPYGSIPPILDDSCTREYSMVVLISGGIGVTPCHSIAKRLIEKQPSSLQKIYYIWSVRDEKMIKAIPPPTLENAAGSSGVDRINHNSDGDEDNGIELVERGLDDEKKSHAENGNDALEANEDALCKEELAKPSLCLQTDIYVTQMDKFVEVQEDEGIPKGSGTVSSSNQKEQATTPYTIHRGRRLDVHAIVKHAHDEALQKGWGRIFVMGCGPMSLREELQAACQKNQKEVQIDFHEEIFDY
jgi:predicted ferric reductase